MDKSPCTTQTGLDTDTYGWCILKRYCVVQILLFSHSVMSNSLRPHGLQHTRLPVLHHLLEFTQTQVQLFVTPWTAACQASCPSPSPGVCSNACPSKQLILAVLLSSCLQSFTESESFLMSWLFTSGGQSIRASSFRISPSNEYSG